MPNKGKGPYRTPPSTGKRRRKSPQLSLKQKKLRRGSTSSSHYKSTSSNRLYDTYSSSSYVSTPTKANYREFAAGKYKRTGNRTWGQAATRAAAVGSGATLGFIAGNVPGLFAGGALAGRAYDATHQGEGFQSLTGLSQTKQNMTTGGWAGKFNTPRKIKANLETMYLKKGFMIGNEIYGTCSDPFAVYVHHSTYDATLMANAFAGALIRKLFLKAGLPITDRNGLIPATSLLDATGFRLEFYQQQSATGALAGSTFDTGAASTLQTIIDAWVGANSLASSVETYLKSGSSFSPYSISLYANDVGVTTTSHRLLAKILLQNEVVDFNITSKITMQNRTKADGALDFATDRIDNQPLIGTCYKFKNEPRLKNVDTNSQQIFLQGTTPTGLKLFGAATFTTPAGQVDHWENRPNAKIFSNCHKAASTILQPGQMKSSYLSFNLNGKLNNLFPKLRLEASSTTQVTGIKCLSEMFVFEEKMRTGVINWVSVHYERKINVGCYLTTKKQDYVIDPKFNSLTLNFP